MYDTLTELYTRHNADQCKKVRNKMTSPPSDAYPNMTPVLQGYNVFKGSPFSKSDEGFSSRLWVVDWDDSDKDSFGKRRPRDTNVRNIDKCSSSTST